VNAEARAVFAQSAPNSSLVVGLESAAFLTALPLPGDLAAALSGNPDAAAATAGGTPLVLGVLGGAYAADGSGGARTHSANLEFAVDLSAVLPTEPLRFGFLNPVATGGGFDTLRLQIFKENTSVLDQSFTSLATALSFFDDEVLDLGPANAGVSGPLDLQMLFTYTSDTVGDSFALDFVGTSIPEPASGLLAVGGLTLILGHRRSRRP
jgi:hypothetical protein